MARLDIRILGCGSSGGVPRLGPDWGLCDPSEPKNRRRRCALLLTRHDHGGATRVLIDTGPDLREQLLDAGVTSLDGVVYTHAHADHVHGLDDLRLVVTAMQRQLDLFADPTTAASLRDRFAYAFEQPEGSLYPAICRLTEISGPVSIIGAGGAITLVPFTVDHGGTAALGFRVEQLAYLPDVRTIPEPVFAELDGLKIFILDALRRKPHPTHAHLALSLSWLERLRPDLGVLTNMHNDMDYATLCAELPKWVIPAHDGLTLSLEVD